MNIVKPGNLGTGLLIEYDAGHISPSESRNKKIIKEMGEFTHLIFYVEKLTDTKT